MVEGIKEELLNHRRLNIAVVLQESGLDEGFTELGFCLGSPVHKAATFRDLC